jgi:hypothetical protein
MGTLLGSWLQGRRDDRRWRRQEVAVAYAQAQTLLNRLMIEASLAIDARQRREQTNGPARVVEIARQLNDAMDRVQMFGSRQVCGVAAEIMPGAVEPVVAAMDVRTSLSEEQTAILFHSGMLAVMRFTNACRRDLGVKGKSAYDPTLDSRT